MTQLRKAIFLSVLNQHSLQLVSILSIAILARLLSPEEVGLFSVATSITFLATELRSFGVGEYLVREKEVNKEKIRKVLGVMFIMSWGLAFILLASSSFFANFYGKPELMHLLWITSVPFFLAPHSSIPYSLLVREMKYDAILKINLSGSLMRNGASIGLVLLGYSYYGLAWGTLAGTVVEFLLITYFRPKNMPWLPIMKDLKQVFQIGMQISISKFLITGSQNASDLVLGRMSTMSNVGHFSRGLGLISFLQNILTNAVTGVTLSHLSQVRRNDGDVSAAYVQAASLIGAFTIPLFAVVSLAAHPMINALFGDQWNDSVRIASILSFWAMLVSVHCFAIHALLTVGKERLLLFKEFFSVVVKVTLIILAIQQSLEAVAWGFVISGAFDLVIATFILKSAIHLSLRSFALAYVPNLITAAACWSTLKIISLNVNLQELNPWTAIAVIGASMIPVWLLSIKLTKSGAWQIIEDIAQKALKSLVSR